MMQAFARAAAEREKMWGSDFIEAILRERPDLRGQEIEFPQQGNNAHVVFIGNEVFKGPRGIDMYGHALSEEDLSKAIDNLDKEVKILQQLERKGLPIPRVTYVSEGSAFFGMTRLPGDVLDKKFEEQWTEKELRTLAGDLINFVIKLANAVPQKNGAFLVQDDFGYRNILLHPGTKKFSGIVDFGFADYRTEDKWTIYGGHAEAFRTMLKEEFNRRKSEIRDSRQAKPGPSAQFSP